MRELAKAPMMFSLVGIGGSMDGFWNCGTGIASGNGDDVEDADVSMP